MPQKDSTLLQRMDRVCPPFLAYALAGVLNRQDAPWLGLKGIHLASGLPVRTVIRLGSQISWRRVKLGVASDFLRGCGIGLDDEPRIRAYFLKTMQSKRPFPHLNDPLWLILQRRCAAWLTQSKTEKRR